MDLIIDNVGFPLSLAAMSEKEFVETHLPNDAIARALDEKGRIKYLKGAYAAIKAKTTPPAEVESK